MYTCDNYYQGGGYSTCQSNGQWTEKPECSGRNWIELNWNRQNVIQFKRASDDSDFTFSVITCERLDFPTDGERNPRFGPYNCHAAVTYSCNAGYSMRGPPVMYCDDNGVWSSLPPICVPSSGMTSNLAFLICLFLIDISGFQKVSVKSCFWWEF